MSVKLPVPTQFDRKIHTSENGQERSMPTLQYAMCTLRTTWVSQQNQLFRVHRNLYFEQNAHNEQLLKIGSHLYVAAVPGLHIQRGSWWTNPYGLGTHLLTNHS
eukprot:2847623-Amphidinium_carterae.2